MAVQHIGFVSKWPIWFLMLVVLNTTQLQH
jgi:hypothetical protein